MTALEDRSIRPSLATGSHAILDVHSGLAMQISRSLDRYAGEHRLSIVAATGTAREFGSRRGQVCLPVVDA